MTVRNLNTVTDYATWTLAIAALPAPLVANTVLEDQDGATYNERILLDSVSMGGFTLTLRQKAGEAMPTVTSSTASGATVRVSNTIGVIIDGLIIINSNNNFPRAVTVGVDSGGATGANTVTIQNCEIQVTNGAPFSGRGVNIDSYGAWNNQTITINDCTFSGTYTEAVFHQGYQGTHTFEYNRCKTSGVIGDTGLVLNIENGGDANFTANVRQLNMNTGTGRPFSLSAGGRTLTLLMENCRLYGNWDNPGSFSCGGGTGTFTVRGCTFVSTHTGNPLQFSPGSAVTSLNFRDNIIASRAANGGGAKLISLNNANAVTNSTLDYNLFYLENPTGNYVGHANGVNYSTLANWQAIGKDANSVFGSPSFIDIATGDLDISPGSLAEGAGITIVGMTVDIDGDTRPDPPAIGAYDALVPLVETPSDTAIATDSVVVTKNTLMLPGLTAGSVLGGDSVLCAGSGFSCAAISDDFGDASIGAIWTAINANGGTAVEADDTLRLMMAAAASSVAGVRTVSSYADLDATVDYNVTKAFVPSAATRSTPFSLVTAIVVGTTDVRIDVEADGFLRYVRGRLRVAGTTTHDFIVPLGKIHNATGTLRILRAGARVWAWHNSTVLIDGVVWTTGNATVELAARSAAVDQTSTAFASAYVRKPVVTFDDLPGTVTDFDAGFISVLTPARTLPGSVDVRATAAGPPQTRASAFTYIWPVSARRILDTELQVIVLSESILKRR